MPWVGLQCVIVLFPNHTHLLVEAMANEITDYIALFGTYCIFSTNVHRGVIEFKQLIFVAKNKSHKKSFSN